MLTITASDGRVIGYSYDKFNRTSELKQSVAGVSLNNKYHYNAGDGSIRAVSLNGTTKLSYGFDGFGRQNIRKLYTATPFVTEYTFLEGTAGNTTTLVKSVKNGNETLQYAYDKIGNITSISKNGTVVESYTYDSLNQLKTVTRGSDVWEYTYDNGGNILSVKKNGTAVKTYGYTDANWKDKLTSFNGQTITYDAIGNPLQYRDGFNFTWANGRQLATVTNGTNTYSYTYNADGLRTSKTVNGTTTEYYWMGSVLQGQKTGSEYILYLYDENGTAYGFLLKNGTTHEYYYYIFNAQGDVIGILDSNGTKVVSYEYSAWGEVLSITGTLANTIGQTNPIRYRGYYYDTETGFHYLQSRYYDPTTQRFINSDKYASTGQGILGFNMFVYCTNNSVNYKDTTGQATEDIDDIISVLSDYFECMWNYFLLWLNGKTGEALAVAQTIYGEAGGSKAYPNEWRQGREAVAWTIINRYNSNKYPNSWYKIVTAEKQFTGYNLGKTRYENNDLEPASWRYAYKLATYMVLGWHDKIPYPKEFTEYHMYFRSKKVKIQSEWGGVQCIGGNNFFYYKSEVWSK